MKALIISVAIIVSGCTPSYKTAPPATTEQISVHMYETRIGPDIYAYVIEGHKYFVPKLSGVGGMIHAESCPCKSQ